MNEQKLPSRLGLTALLAGGLTMMVSLIYTVLCAVVLAIRHKCDIADPAFAEGSSFFTHTFYRVYLQAESCDSALQVNEITQRNTVFTLIIVTLSFSLASVITSAVLIATATTRNMSNYISFATYLYAGVWICSLIVDITFAAHFGRDYSNLNDLVNINSPGVSLNYMTDVLRIGAFFLLTITLKGFVTQIINLLFIILLLVFVIQYERQNKADEHSIHKLGALDAFDWKENKDTNQWQQTMDQTLPTGSRINNRLVDDNSPRRSYTRELSDYSNNRSFDRSDSWHHSKPGQASRSPFRNPSEISRYKSPPSPALDSRWDRDWPPPPVPIPDYSPQPARRLKSVLKPVYT